MEFLVPRLNSILIFLMITITISTSLFADNAVQLDHPSKKVTEDIITLNISDMELRSISTSNYGLIFTYSNNEASVIYGFDTKGNQLFSQALDRSAFKSSFLSDGSKYWVVHGFGEENIRYDIYDAISNSRRYSFNSKYWLKPYKNGVYYFCTYHPFEPCLPAVYGLNGDLLWHMDSRYGVWDIEPLDDSTVLYLDGNELYIISLIDSSIKRKTIFSEFDKASLFVGIDVSPDNKYCAVYTGYDIAIYSIVNDGKYILSSFDNSAWITNGSVILSNNACLITYLKYSQGNILCDIYKRDTTDSYINVVYNKACYSTSPHTSFVDKQYYEDYTIVHIVSDDNGDPSYRSLIMRNPQPDYDSFRVMILGGYVVSSNDVYHDSLISFTPGYNDNSGNIINKKTYAPDIKKE